MVEARSLSEKEHAHTSVPISAQYPVFSSHSFWTSSSLDVPAEVTQEEGHTGFLIHLLSAVRALIFLAFLLARKIKARTAERRWMRNPV